MANRGRMREIREGEVPFDGGTAIQEDPDRPAFRGNGPDDYVCVQLRQRARRVDACDADDEEGPGPLRALLDRQRRGRGRVGFPAALRRVSRVGRLDELDLTKSLTRKEEARRLDRAWERLTQLRLTLGGLIGDGTLGPPVCVRVRGLGRIRKGRRDQAARRPDRPAPRPRRPVRRADARREAPPLPVALLARAPRLGRDGRVRPLVVRPRAGGAGRGLRHREQWLRAYDEINGFERTLADEGMILVKFWLHISADEQLQRFERREKDPLKAWKLDRRGLAQPRQARRVRARRSRTCSRAPTSPAPRGI